MLKSVYENYALFCMCIFKLLKRFRQVHEDLEDIKATGSHMVPKIQTEVQNINQETTEHFREAKFLLPLLGIECQII
jgi:hypothetical protein